MYKCNRSECSKVFTQSSNCYRHQKTCSKGEIIVKSKASLLCENSWCNRSFHTRYNLVRHKLTCKAKTAKAYKCTHCGKTFDRQGKLDKHEASHNKDLYSCDSCPAIYSRKDKFLLHQKKCALGLVPQQSSFTRTSMVENDELGRSGQQNESDDEVMQHGDASDLNITTSSMDSNGSSLIQHSMGTSLLQSSESSFFQPTIFDYGEPSSRNVTVHDVGSDINHVHDVPQVYILDETMDCSGVSIYNSDAYLDNIEYESEISKCTLRHLRLLKHEGKRSSVKLQEFSTLCSSLFFNARSKKFDLTFMYTLAKDLGFHDAKELEDFVSMERCTPKRGRPLHGVVGRQLMYDFWKDNSEISNDRRNARHVVKVNPQKEDHAVVDLVDTNVTECQTKGGVKHKAQKQIYSLTVRELFKCFRLKYPEIRISATLFYRCKPFYISPPSDREMEGCLCAKCLNPHSLYNTLRRYIKDLPTSLSEYLTMYFECDKDQELNFYKDECIKANCKNNCKITDESTKSYDWTKHVSYYQFEPVRESYYDRNGEKRFYQRTTRKDYRDVTLKNVYNLLQECARSYLSHRYHTLLDKVYWEKYLAEIDSPVVWMDYSQNIKLTEKNQAQSGHFSGRQQTLHDSLIQYPDEDFKYVYHLSDDTNHDSVMTTVIVEGNIINHPEIIESGKLVLRSDNCSTQYKSRFVFKALLDLAKKYSIRIDFFYGEAGHGRGLIDAMAWFGCKGPLRRDIVTHDTWYKDVEEMVAFLMLHFKNDPKKNKEYNIIPAELTANLRKQGREERFVPGCTQAHVISFFPDGQLVKQWTTIKAFTKDDKEDADDGTNENEGEEIREDETEEIREEDTEVDWSESLADLDMYSLISIGSFVAIRSAPGTHELFHLMKVEDKGIAAKRKEDSSKEHCVLKNEPYLVGKWFSFQKETKKFAQYSEARGTEEALIHIREVFSTNVELNDKYQLDIHEYRMLACSAF